MKDYIEELYSLNIISRHVDEDVEKVAMYLNELIYGFEDEIIFVKLAIFLEI